MKKTSDLTRSREFCVALLEAIPDGLVISDAKGRIILANNQAETMFGYSGDELLGEPIELLLPERFRASHTEQRAAYASSPAIRRMGSGIELVAQRRDGTEFPVEIALSPLTTEFGECTIAIVRDATERRRAEEELIYLSGHDALTGLNNRHTFEQQQASLARGRRFPVSIIVVDLDAFKEINDLYGHAAGDEMLKRAAAVLVQAFRADDTIARMGGDEFAALLPATDRQAAAAAVARVGRLLREHNATLDGPPLSLSIGAATAERGQSLVQCLRDADKAMYVNKISHVHRVHGRPGDWR
jgi:diguanylate cyclase (GGDEF)-like protein/PAS domain S-box-containing protein